MFFYAIAFQEILTPGLHAGQYLYQLAKLCTSWHTKEARWKRPNFHSLCKIHFSTIRELLIVVELVAHVIQTPLLELLCDLTDNKIRTLLSFRENEISHLQKTIRERDESLNFYQDKVTFKYFSFNSHVSDFFWFCDCVFGFKLKSICNFEYWSFCCSGYYYTWQKCSVFRIFICLSV